MKKNKLQRIIILSAAVICVALFFILETNGSFADNKVKIVNIDKGQGFNQISDTLSEDGIVNSKFIFKVYARIFYSDKLNKINAGEAVFDKKSSYREIMEVLISDKRTSDEIKITIPEGYELREIADILEKNALIDRDRFYDVVKNYDFDYPYIKELKKTDTRLEGFLFPDTYMFSRTIDDEISIVKKMLSRFNEIYNKYKQYENKFSYSTYEIVTLASIIEREAANKNDFHNVSSVFHNRLKRADNLSYLQSCATVQYILKERKKVLTIKDTEIDSPYNTYKYPGLPKGPIASPGEAAINAALNPNNTSYLYFLNDKDGKLHFSKTFSEHQANTAKYVN